MRRLTKAQRWVIFLSAFVLSPLSCLMLFSTPRMGLQMEGVGAWIVIGVLFTVAVASLVVAAYFFLHGQLFSSRTYNLISLVSLVALITWMLYGLFAFKNLVTDPFMLVLMALNIVIAVGTLVKVINARRRQRH